MRVNTVEGKLLVDIEARRIDEEFENWMEGQGFGDHQLEEANEMLDNMIASQKALYRSKDES